NTGKLKAPCASVAVVKVRPDPVSRSSTCASAMTFPLASSRVPCQEAGATCAAVATESAHKTTLGLIKKKLYFESLKRFEPYGPEWGRHDFGMLRTQFAAAGFQNFIRLRLTRGLRQAPSGPSTRKEVCPWELGRAGHAQLCIARP